MARRFTRKIEDFICSNCGFEVRGTGYTDHCPKCLWSKHVDINPGDRASKCTGMMEPVRILHGRKNAKIKYMCIKCGVEKVVEASQGDYEQGSIS